MKSITITIYLACYTNTIVKEMDSDSKIASMSFARVYPLYLAKIERKGRTREELNIIIKWLTGFDTATLESLIEQNVTFEEFFRLATINPNAELITGKVCGIKVEEIKNPLTQKIRYLDKLVDDLAKGKSIEKIIPKP
ncbi:DUF2200 domain-containing protein [Tenuifilum osseticum]|uniref:DUF2200 domain-containing protein n=1 Tax=Tenuifilum osseticum TaxID=3374723 RepID=UPI0034E4B9A3